MKVAALDLGTNSFLCLIADVERGMIKNIYSDKVEIVRLGQDVNKTKSFHPEALARAEKAIQVFKNEIDLYKPEKIQAYATSAARDVINKDIFFDILKKYNIPLEVISGKKEAEFTFYGGISALPSNQNYVVVDIGGGSTEIIYGNHTKIDFSFSFNVGTVRLSEMFFTEEKPSQKEVQSMIGLIEEKFEKDSTIFNDILATKAFTLVGVAGTPTEIAKIELGKFDSEKIDGMSLSQNKLSNWLNTLLPMSHLEKVDKFNVTKGRADVIVAGVIILLSVMRKLKVENILVSTKGLRYGIAQKI